MIVCKRKITDNSPFLAMKKIRRGLQQTKNEINQLEFEADKKRVAGTGATFTVKVGALCNLCNIPPPPLLLSIVFPL